MVVSVSLLLIKALEQWMVVSVSLLLIKALEQWMVVSVFGLEKCLNSQEHRC